MMHDKKIHPIDDEFATAADAYFAGKRERLATENDELKNLMDTLARVDDAFFEPVNEDAKERIRKNMSRVWFTLEAEQKEERVGFFDQVRAFFSQNQKPVRFAVSFAMTLLVFALVPFLLEAEPNMAGAASGFGDSKTVTIVLFIALISALFVIFGRQNK